MDISISHQELSFALNIIALGVEKRKSEKAIINNILFSFSQEKVKLTGTDLEVELSCMIDYNGQQPELSFTLCAEKLIALVKSLNEDSAIRFRLKEKKILLTAKNSRFNLMTLPAEEFPNVEVDSINETITLEQRQLKELISNVAYCSAEKDVRHYLNGLLLDVKSSEIISVATDGHRMAVSRLSVSNTQNEAQYILPKKGIAVLIKLLRDVKDSITLSFTENHMVIRTPRLEFTTKLISGSYPSYERVIPKNNNKVLTIDKAEFKSLLNMANCFSSDSQLKPIVFDVKEDKLISSIKNELDEEHVDELAVECNSAINIGFNISYLLQATNTVTDDKVTIKFGEVNGSALVLDPNRTHVTNVVLPMRC